MSVKVETQEHNTAKLTVEVPAEELEKELQAAYIKHKKEFRVPGFRAGKVPRIVVEKTYGVEIFFEEAANALVTREIPKAKEECTDLDIQCNGTANVVQIEKGKPFIFEFDVATRPEVKLGEYKNLEVPIVDASVSDDEIMQQLKRQQEQNSRIVTVEDRPAQLKDTVIIDYSGTIDGEPFKGGTAEDQTLVLGSGTFIPGFEDGIVGHSTGEELDLDVTFPEDYHGSEVAGKPAVFHVVIKKITSKELPELDDEFASEVSSFETLEEYKADIRKELELSRQVECRQKTENAALAKAAKNAEMDLPDILITDQVMQNMENMEMSLQQQGISLQQYAQLIGQTADEMIEDMKPNAEFQLRQRYTLDAIADKEGFVVTDEMYDKKVAEYAEMYGMEKDELLTTFAPKYLDQIRNELKYEQVYELLYENSVQTEAATREAEEEEKKREEEWKKRREERKAAKEAEEAEKEAAEEPAAEE